MRIEILCIYPICTHKRTYYDPWHLWISFPAVPLSVRLSSPISLHIKLGNFWIKLVSMLICTSLMFFRTRCPIYLNTLWSWVLKRTCLHLNGSWLYLRPSSRYLWCFTSSTSFFRRWVHLPHLSVCLSFFPSGLSVGSVFLSICPSALSVWHYSQWRFFSSWCSTFSSSFCQRYIRIGIVLIPERIVSSLGY